MIRRPAASLTLVILTLVLWPGDVRAQIGVLEVPSPGTVVHAPFAISGWVFDPASPDNTSGIDQVRLTLLPASGGAPLSLGAPTINQSRPDIAAIYGPKAEFSGFVLTVVTPIPPGQYTLAATAHRISDGGFSAPVLHPIAVRGATTLSDLQPCSSGQVPVFDGSDWACASTPGEPGPEGPPGPRGPPGP